MVVTLLYVLDAVQQTICVMKYICNDSRRPSTQGFIDIPCVWVGGESQQIIPSQTDGRERIPISHADWN